MIDLSKKIIIYHINGIRVAFQGYNSEFFEEFPTRAFQETSYTPQ